LHGYALEFSATFETTELDDNAWVIDFGGLKDFRKWLEHMFDHTTLIAIDDPMYNLLIKIMEGDALDVRTVENTGCEAIALLAFEKLEGWLITSRNNRVRLVKLEVREHAGNSAYVRLSNCAER
jgi:6-pyruvoyltetrahydropterin/6-carboxytetrahydropterin synthase